MTDCARLLEVLRDGKPHSHHELYRLGMVVHSRVSDLRKSGHLIQVWRERDHDHGRVRPEFTYWYRLVLDVGDHVASPASSAGVGDSAVTGSALRTWREPGETPLGFRDSRAPALNGSLDAAASPLPLRYAAASSEPAGAPETHTAGSLDSSGGGSNRAVEDDDRGVRMGRVDGAPPDHPRLPRMKPSPCSGSPRAPTDSPPLSLDEYGVDRAIREANAELPGLIGDQPLSLEENRRRLAELQTTLFGEKAAA